MKAPRSQAKQQATRATRAGSRSSLRLRASVMLLLSGAVLLVCSAPASALLNQGHVFSATFEGSGAQSFQTPAGIAVNEASGIVYVADPANERVELFEPTSGSYQFVGELKVPDAGAIAVDNSRDTGDPSRGDLYVAGAGSGEEAESGERNFLYKFTASGEKILKKRVFKAREDKEEFEAELEDISGVAVDATGKLWLYWYEEGDISGFSDDEQNKLQPALSREGVLEQALLETPCLAEPGFAVGPSDEAFYVAHERETGFGDCPEGIAPTPTMVSRLEGSGVASVRSLDRQTATGVALDSSVRDVYVDNATSIAAFGPQGTFVQRFGAGNLSEGGPLAIDSARGIVYVAEPGKVAVFTREGAGPPTVDSVSAQSLSPSSERIDAQIDPDGASTTFHVQYGTESCAEHESSCSDAAEQEVGEGFGDVGVHATLEGLSPNTTYYYRVIAKNAQGTAMSAQSTQTFFTTLPSPEGVVLDHRQWQLVSPSVMHGATSEALNPVDLGSLIQASADGSSLAWTASGPISGEAQGNHQPEPVQVISTRGSEEWTSKEVSTPHSRGEGVTTEEPTEYRFFSPDLALSVVEPQFLNEPLENPPLTAEAKEKTIYLHVGEDGEFEPLVTAANDQTGTPFGGKLAFQGATADVKHVVFRSEVPLVEGALGTGLYEWEAGAPLKLLSVLPGSEHTPASEPALGYHGFDVRGAISQDGSRFFWTNEGELGPLYMRDTTSEETIEVNAAQGVREAGAEEIEDGLDEVHFQLAASDGAKAFFTDTWPLTSESALEPSSEVEAFHAADLYEYDADTGKLTDLTVTRNAGEQAEVLGTLPGASEDGSYVYFVANGVLAPGAERGNCPRISPIRIGASPEGECNLYVSQPDPEDPGQRETRLIARLSDEDANDWGEGNAPVVGDLGGVTAQVSGNGRYLAFMSDRDLTGYDNIDANPGAEGAADQEVFLYDASAGRLVCASCNPDGQPPVGVFDTRHAGEGEGLTVDRPELWSGQWLAGSIPGWTLYGYDPPMTEHQSRYLSNNGRLFFDGADALVAQDQAPTRQETVNGKTLDVGVENVYEYEPDDIGSCQQASGCVALISSGTSERESAFLDASEYGDDVFFSTVAKLVAQDSEPGHEVYAAAECGTGEAPRCLPEKPPPPEECNGEACRAPAGPQLGIQIPPTYTSSPADTQVAPSASPANKPKTAATTKPAKLTLAQKLSKALEACRKLERAKQRQACERKARKAYAAKGKRTSRRPARTPSSKGKGR